VQGSTAVDHCRRGADAVCDAQPASSWSERLAPARTGRRSRRHRLHHLALERTPGPGVVTASTGDSRSPTPALLLGLIVTLAAVARLLVENNASEEQMAAQVRDIYARVQRQVYIFLAATFVVIALTSLYLIRSNRQLFARLSTLSNDRRELAQQLFATRESTL